MNLQSHHGQKGRSTCTVSVRHELASVTLSDSDLDRNTQSASKNFFAHTRRRNAVFLCYYIYIYKGSQVVPIVHKQGRLEACWCPIGEITQWRPLPHATWPLLTERCALCGFVKELQLKVFEKTHIQGTNRNISSSGGNWRKSTTSVLFFS